MSDKPSFFAELKRRNVIRVAGLYLVGAWLLTQVASTVLPTFEVPSWVLRALIVTLIVAFIPAIIFSWIFELTPQGLKREEEIAPAQSIAPQTGRRMDRVIIAVLILALGYFAFDKFVLGQRREKPAATAASSESKVANEKSVAVFAFENLSDDKGSEYFSDGISEELLTVLQKIPGLRVAARTSAFSFKGKNATAQEIGDKLGVARLVDVGATYLFQVNFEEAVAAAQKDAADWARLLIVSCARWSQKRIPESDTALGELIAKAGEIAAYQVAEAYAYRDDKDHAFEWLERARRQRDGGLPTLRGDLLLRNLHDDPRWAAFLREMGLADDQLK